jgi:hypothetical protein
MKQIFLAIQGNMQDENVSTLCFIGNITEISNIKPRKSYKKLK